MRPELIYLFENFVSQKEIVKDLYECSEEFMTLCMATSIVCARLKSGKAQ
jgi:hypothetical protein